MTTSVGEESGDCSILKIHTFRLRIVQIFIEKRINIFNIYRPFTFFTIPHWVVRGSAVGSGTMLQAGRSRASVPIRSLDFSINLTHPAELWPWVDSTLNRNEYQDSSWG
jgi:hypothetical protein